MQGIWAIARQTLMGALRKRLLVALLVFLIILVSTFPFTLRTDQTQKGRIQVVITYSLSSTFAFLCCLTLLVGARSISHELRSKQLRNVVVKPVTRSQILLGKWLGIALVNASVLLVVGGLLYAAVWFLARPEYDPAVLESIRGKQPGELTMTDRRHLESAVEYQKVRRELLVARRGFRTVEGDLEEMALDKYEELQREGKMSPGMSRDEALGILRGHFRSRAVSPGMIWEWDIEGLEPGGEMDVITLRFKCNASNVPEDQMVGLRWRVGGEEKEDHVGWLEGRWKVNTFHEIPIPASLVTSDGTLSLAVQNIDMGNTVVMFPRKDGIEVMQPVGKFGLNLAKGLVLLFCQTCLLAMLAVVCSSCLSFPVACLCSFVILIFSLSVGFLGSMADKAKLVVPPSPMIGETPRGSEINMTYQRALRGALAVLPDVRAYNPIPALVGGREIGRALLFRAVGILVLLRGGILALLGAAILARRELATAFA